MNHLNTEQLVDYFDRMWLPEQEREIECHLATCDECAARAYKVFEAIALLAQW